VQDQVLGPVHYRLGQRVEARGRDELGHRAGRPEATRLVSLGRLLVLRDLVTHWPALLSRVRKVKPGSPPRRSARVRRPGRAPPTATGRGPRSGRPARAPRAAAGAARTAPTARHAVSAFFVCPPPPAPGLPPPGFR